MRIRNTRQALRLAFSTLALVLLATVGGCDCDDPPVGEAPTTAPPAWPDGVNIAVVEGSTARRLTPGERTDVTVLVTDDLGTPLSHVAVLFVAPSEHPSGAFGASEPDAPNQQLATTDDSGRTTAQFAAGDPLGVFLVNALVLDSFAWATVAITIEGVPWQPALPMEDVTAWLESCYPYIQGAVAGPLLLPSGAVLRDRGGEEEQSWPIESPSWLTWIDPDPRARRQRHSRLLVLETGDADPSACTKVHRELRPVGAVEVTLPHDGVPRLLAHPARPHAGPRAPMAGQPSQAPGEVRQRHCAIVAVGAHAKKGDFTPDLELVETFFRDHYRADRVFARGITTFSEFQQMVSEAHGASCTVVHLYMGGHSGGEAWGWSPYAANFAFAAEDDDDTEVRRTQTEITETLQAAFGNPNTTLQVYLDQCHAERSVAEYQGRGLQGDIYASSRSGEVSYSTYYSSFTYAFFERWRLNPSLPPSEVFYWLDQDLSARLYSSNTYEADLQGRMTPDSYPIQPGTTDWSEEAGYDVVPDVVIVRGETELVSVERPHTNSHRVGDFRSPHPDWNKIWWPRWFNMWVNVEVDNLAVASPLPTSPNIFLRWKHPDAVFPVMGLNTGETRYTVFSRSRHDAYQGSGVIRVVDQCDPEEECVGSEIEASCPELLAFACDRSVCRQRPPAIRLVAEGPPRSWKEGEDCATLGCDSTAEERRNQPTINDHGEVLTWGYGTKEGYSLHDGLTPVMTLEDSPAPDLPVCSRQHPVVFEGYSLFLETRFLPFVQLPSRLSNARHFPFVAAVMDDAQAASSERLGLFIWQDGSARWVDQALLPSFFGPFIPMNRTGAIAYQQTTGLSLDDYDYPNDAGAIFAHADGCPLQVVTVGDPFPDATGPEAFDQIFLHQMLDDGGVVFSGRWDDGQPRSAEQGIFVWRGGDIETVVPSRSLYGDPYDGYSTSVEAVSRDGRIVYTRVTKDLNSNDWLFSLWSTAAAGDDPHRTVLASNTPIAGNLYPAWGTPFVTSDDRVGVVGWLVDDSGPAPVKDLTGLWLEDGQGDLQALAMEGDPAHCLDGFTFAELGQQDTRVWVAGTRVWFKARATNGMDEVHGLWLFDGDRMQLAFHTGQEVTLTNGSMRTVGDFGLAGRDGAGYPFAGTANPPALGTNHEGALVLDVAYGGDSPEYSGNEHGVWVVGEQGWGE